MKMKTGFLSVLTLAAITVSANAATITYQSNAFGRNATINYFGTSSNTVAGLFNIGLTGGPVGYPTQFKSFCVDLQHTISQGQSWDVNLVPIPDPALNNSGRIAYLYTNYSNVVATNDDAAGLQLAAWDVLVDGGDGISTGNFQASNTTVGAVTAANTFLANSLGQAGNAMWLVSTDGSRQNLVGPTQCVPEPGALSLVGTALLPLLGFSRRRR